MQFDEWLFWRRVLDEAPSWEKSPELLDGKLLGNPEVSKPSQTGRTRVEYAGLRALHLEAIKALRHHRRSKRNKSQAGSSGPSIFYHYSRRFAELLNFCRAGMDGDLADGNPALVLPLWERYQDAATFAPVPREDGVPGLRGLRVPPAPVGEDATSWKEFWEWLIPAQLNSSPNGTGFTALWWFLPDRHSEEIWMYGMAQNSFGARTWPLAYVYRSCEGGGVVYPFSGRKGGVWKNRTLSLKIDGTGFDMEVDDRDWRNPYLVELKSGTRRELPLVALYSHPAT